MATALILYKDQGLAGLKQRLLEKATQAIPKIDYQTWLDWFGTLTNQDRASIKKHIMTFKCQPKKGDLCENIQHHWLHYTLIINVSSSKVRYGLVGIPFELVTLEVIHE